VNELRPVVRAAIPEAVELTVRFAPDTPDIKADVNQIRQLIVGLVMNAAEAIGENSGAVEICTGAQTVRSPGEGLPAGFYACLEVRDTGCGMDASVQARIFDPFFTTKFAGRGLGLAAALGIVRGHRGSIQVRSAPGKGSTFRVLLPAFDPQARAAEPQEARAVLVVDDEPIVRQATRHILSQAGFEPIMAVNGREALQVFQTHTDRIALVILDLAMPGMDGAETLRALRQIRPSTRVLVASGYGERDVVEQLAGQHVDGFVQKPFTVQRLTEAVRAVLAPK
jgi:CheY-like chemotaxis protein